MNWLALSGFAAMICVSLTASSTMAQERPTPGIVAVLDVANVFQSNREFDEKMKLIRQEAEQLKNTVQSQQEQIRLDAQPLQGMQPNSPQAKQLELELEQRQASLRAQARQSEADLLIREAAAYYDTYQKMLSVVTVVAQENGISMVLRFDGSSIDPQNRGDVIKGVNRAVVFHQNLDLTNLVLERMGPRVATANNPNLK